MTEIIILILAVVQNNAKNGAGAASIRGAYEKDVPSILQKK